jgi:hypothetical protein
MSKPWSTPKLRSIQILLVTVLVIVGTTAAQGSKQPHLQRDTTARKLQYYK